MNDYFATFRGFKNFFEINFTLFYSCNSSYKLKSGARLNHIRNCEITSVDIIFITWKVRIEGRIVSQRFDGARFRIQNNTGSIISLMFFNSGF